MVSHRDLQDVVEQINSSYKSLLERIIALETQVENLKALSTPKVKSKEKP